jgi:AraC family transcriptional regulator, transcriptional activator of the genes for pyochelin and ferripyochelin receptors
MTTDIVEVNNFIVLIEQSIAEKTIVEKCGFDEEVIGFAFYGSGNVELEVNFGSKTKTFNNTTGVAISFFGNNKVEFAHRISYDKPLQCISVFSKVKNLHELPAQESSIFSEYLCQLINPDDDFVEGPCFYMTPEMQNAVQKILSNQYTGSTRMMFLKSQVTELLSHFFGLLSKTGPDTIKKQDKEKLHYAKEILCNNIETPPTLNELSRLIGLNSYKLKKNFKELFGVPVFKYLQNERLNKAYDLLSQSDMGIQEAAWAVGYESLSSFSNAFIKKFGFRPSEIKK